MSDYKVQLEVFEGPLDLLLYLIKKEEVDIYNIPIARITSQYMEYLELIKMLAPEVAGEFVVMGATLMYIKSRMLLPQDQQVVDPEAEGEELDPRWELIRQLIEYKKFKDAALQLQQREIHQGHLFAHRPPGLELEPASVEDLHLGQIGTFDLLTAFNQLLKRLQAPDDLREIFEDRHTVSGKIDFILKLMEAEERATFGSLFDGAASRVEMIVTFLAILELIRLKQLRAEQPQPFGEIQIIRIRPETPAPAATPPQPALNETAPSPPENPA